ncbi:MAG: ankyrin repeat domain-containing protein [Chlamydiae bacterium]|nr:ankyrin repeat domain-containing protein [Chlamydiota bacterium]
MEKIFEELIKQDANVNIRRRNGYRPLHLAVMYNWFEGLKLLTMSPNIKINALSNSKKTVLDFAIENNRKEMIEWLLKKGAMESSKL